MSMDMSQNPDEYNADAPEDMEDIHQNIRMFGTTLTLKIFDDALNNPAFNPVLKRWMTRRSNGTQRGKFGAEEWQMYCEWVEHKTRGDDFEALTPLKKQMKKEALADAQAVYGNE